MYGDEVCQLNAGWMLSQPVGYYGDDHDQMAVQFWRLAADQGSAIAQRVLGDYCYAEVVSGGVQEAIRRYQQAADRADAQAMFNLGYLHQWGPKQDLHLAKRYYDQAKQVTSRYRSKFQRSRCVRRRAPRLTFLHSLLFWRYMFTCGGAVSPRVRFHNSGGASMRTRSWRFCVSHWQQLYISGVTELLASKTI